ncbi:H-NS family nucleoid-associated regulatory protein [Roseovarius aestuariivivens]|uniref:H-NS histone family protein n=1 Tax=Roseovarius aestuariivivens TaxID=1888910 RepID=UPI001AEBAA38|nr:H-NS histone family protein [Roseovarius aestuariivivens]
MAKKMNLDALSLSELKTLEKDVAKAIDRAEKRERKEALDKLESEAKKLGFTLAELLSLKSGGRKSSGPRSKAAPKYQHPDDPTVTWTGRGRQPKWIKDGLAAGKSLDDFLIK